MATVKYARIPLILLCIFIVTPSAWAILLSIDNVAGGNKIPIGGTAAYQINVSDLEDALGAFELDFTFDPQILNYTSKTAMYT